MLVMRLNYNKDKQRVAYFERSARAAAGSTKAAEGKGQRKRKVKVPMVEGNEGRGVLDLIVEGDNVYLVSTSLRIYDAGEGGLNHPCMIAFLENEMRSS